ncbi:MAG: hypothetical protein AB8G14_14980 [Ilumatobacter sp.]
MSNRRSPSAFTGDDDATPPRGTPVTNASNEWDDDEWDDEWDEPNYLVRRGLVVAAVVAGIALVSIGVSQFIGGDGGSSNSSSAQAEWDTLVVLTRDQVRLQERDSGDEIDTFDSVDDLLDAQSLVAGNVLVTMTDEGRINQIDLTDGTSRRGRAGLDETLIISPDNPQVAIAGPDAGGDVTIIDTVERNVLSVADVAGLDSPLIFNTDVLVNTVGTHVAVPVPNAFQSVVIDLTEETSDALAGRVIAISDELVVTEQPAGSESEIEFHDLLGERLASVDVPAPQAALLFDSTLLLVAEDGSIRTVTSNGTVDEVGSVIDEAGNPLEVSSGAVAFDGERLVVTAGRQVVILDASGNQLGAALGQMSTSPTRPMRCVVVGGSSSTSASAVLELETGAVIATTERGLPAARSFDGCTVAFFGGPSPQLLTDGELTEVDANSVGAIAPDGGAYVVLDGRDTEYVEVGEDGDTIELADEPAVIHFGRRS